MNHERQISIEVFRDIEAPDISIDAALAGLGEIKRVVGPIHIVERSGQLDPTQIKTSIIETLYVPKLDIQTDFGVIVTNRPMVPPVADQQQLLDNNRVIVGRSWNIGDYKPFVIIDALRSINPRNTTMHETAHLLGIRNDKEGHCLRPDCIMHSKISIEQIYFCNECTRQLTKSALRLIETNTT
jgi:hypothetical protein